MKNKVARLLCLIICLATVLTFFAACNTGDGNDKETDTQEQETNAPIVGGPATDENGYELDSINRTLGGKTMTILFNETEKNRVYCAEDYKYGSDTISDEVYMSNLELEERMQCTIEPIFVPGENSNRVEFLTVAQSAGDHNIDIICSFSLWPAVLASQGYLSNLNNLAYPEIDKPWWSKSIKDWEHEGALYFVSNNSSIGIFQSLETMFYNVDMVEDYGLNDLLPIVIEGKWTMDLMLEYAKHVDTNIDDPFEERVYGLAVDDWSRMDMFLYGAGIHFVEKNGVGELELLIDTATNKERVISLITKLGEIAQYDEFHIESNNMLTMHDGRTMFFAGSLNKVTKIPDSVNYTVIPVPKFNDDQKEYYSVNNNGYDMWCIPATCNDKEDSAILIEAFASDAYRNLAPFYYEDKLKMRYSDSELGAQVFDIIRDSVSADFGRVCSQSIGILESGFRYCFWTNNKQTYNTDYISQLEIKLATHTIQFPEVLAAFAKYKDR